MGTTRGALLSFLALAGLLALTVGAALLGKHGGGGITAGSAPSAATRRTASAVSSPGAVTLVSPTPPSFVDPLSAPVWEPPPGSVRQLPVNGNLNTMAANGDAVYYENYAPDGRAQVWRLDVATGADTLVARLPAGHDAGALAAADGRVAWVEWWALGGAFTGGPCAPGQPVEKAWRIWLRDAAHPSGRVIASGTAREGWIVAEGCLDPVPPRVALSADAIAFDVRSAHTAIEIHALSDGRLLFGYDAGIPALVTDLRLGGDVLAVAVQELGAVATADAVTLVRWRDATPSLDSGPGLGVALAADGSVALVVQPVVAGGTGQRVGMSLNRHALIGVTAPRVTLLAPAPGAPDGEYADTPAIGTWQGAEAYLWRGIAPDDNAYPVLQIAGEPRVLLGYGSPGWTAISGHWAMWTDVTAQTPTLDVLDLSQVPVAPALTATHPSVTVTPASGLVDGQSVEVRVTGFGVGSKVWLSECASAQDASSLGCGAQLAAQPFLVTDDSRSGAASFTVSPYAATQPEVPSPSVRCAEQCVIVATLGGGLAYAVAPIPFSPRATLLVRPCTSEQLAVSVVDTGGGAGTVEGWLRFANTSALPCELSGWPTLVGVTASGSTTLARHSNVLLNQPPDATLPSVTLTPGDAAVAAFAGGDNPAGAASSCPPSYHTLRVTPPGTSKSVTLSAWNYWLGADLPACVGIEGTMVVPAASVPDLMPYRP